MSEKNEKYIFTALELKMLALKDSTNELVFYDDNGASKRFVHIERGEWIENPDETFASTFHCSECGEYPLFYDNEYCFSNFCPNCGADMRGANDTEEE